MTKEVVVTFRVTVEEYKELKLMSSKVGLSSFLRGLIWKKA